jgi:hypothetical protein
MARTKKIENKVEDKTQGHGFEDLLFEGMPPHRVAIIKQQNPKDLKQLAQALLIEWARGRVRL